MLSVHLRKEWHEQRVLLLGTIAVLAVVAVGYGLFVPAKFLPSDADLWFVIVALGAGFVGLAGDLVPGEQRRGQLGLLLRTPGAMRRAFAAKLVVLLGGLTVLLLAGLALGGLSLWLSGGRGLPARVETIGFGSVAIAGVAIGIGTCAPWAFAVSCWLPRGSSVVPVTALTISAVAAPPVLVAAIWSVPVTRAEMASAIALVFGGGVLAAWLSFVRGLRFGRRFATVLNGLVAALVFVVPSWAWCGNRVWAWYRVNPSDRDVRIGDVLLGANLRTAFVGLQRNWLRNAGPCYAMVVDLESGQHHQLGPAQSYVRGAGSLSGSEWLTGVLGPQPYVLCERLDGTGEHVLGHQLIDGRSGDLACAFSEWRIPDGFATRLAAAARATTPFVLPGGGRAWLEGGSVVVEDGHGTRTTIPWPEGARPSWGYGLGLRWFGEDGKGYTGAVLDLTRHREVRLPMQKTVFVGPGWWWVEPTGFRSAPCRWNPDTGEFRVVESPMRERPTAMTGDGRFVFCGNGDGPRIADTALQNAEALTCDDGRTPSGVHSAAAFGMVVPAPRTPGGADVFLAVFQDAANVPWRSFVRREGSLLTPTTAVRAQVRLVAIPDDDHVLVIRDDRTLERWRFGSDEVEVLFRVGGAAVD